MLKYLKLFIYIQYIGGSFISYKGNRILQKDSERHQLMKGSVSRGPLGTRLKMRIL